ncbi:Orn/Lys/Arg decarboxylase N-terminal domain-containing protein [Polyangium jinanense]|uniref:Orn/Lys/Arg family decarboxylase n=1 Tax=Polyangium jinanense TaxID=2829994 RepID=UPI002341FC06|nr:Orn/Lys/Arg decarboxylase N-terminal domain-containing protein [Polyangium jinanense]
MINTTLDFPILLVDADFHSERAAGVFMRRLAQELERLGFRVLNLATFADAATVAGGFNAFSCILLSAEGSEETPDLEPQMKAFLDAAHRKSDDIPIFYIGERRTVEAVHLDFLTRAKGVIYLFEDTAEFIARQIARTAQEYLDNLLPPFFKAMVRHAEQSAYSWHTPGHAGGVAFIKSPVGRAFHQFYGENAFRTDLSISVPELGSLLDHTGPIADAEAEAARNFGADHTLFVINGNSTANKIVWHGMVGRDDIVLVDRNCHKSILHSIVMTGAIPVYFVPSRNKHGIIGPIGLDQFSPSAIAEKIAANPLARNHGKKARLAVVTNSTYDGICYNADAIKERVGGAVDALHFDEAWYAYAAFHKFYDGHYGMAKGSPRAEHPIVFATQSTHKLLAAFSQAAMVHVKNSQKQSLDLHRFNDAFLMHTSTSPNYPILASIDVASRMMAGRGGHALLQETIEEALTFRRLLRDMRNEFNSRDWWFSTWQPDQVPLSMDRLRAEDWQLRPDDRWHGFANLRPGQAILDPIKVTLICPGLDAGKGEVGIPAAVVSKYLWERGLTVEKTGIYSLLVLFSIGITKGKWSTLLTELIQFKRLYDANAPLEVSLRSVASRYAGRKLGLRDLCTEIHESYQANNLLQAIQKMYLTLPEPAMRPADAYQAMVHGQVERVDIEEAIGRVAASMVAPTPPGIPVIMPGERLMPESRSIIDYLRFTREFDLQFPGFESEIHGVRIEGSGSKRRYTIDCVKE